MAQNDALVVVPGTGYLWTDATGATAPTPTQLATFVSAGTVPGSYTAIGHTDLDNIVSFSQTGGDTAVKGSWQVSSLRTILTSKPVDSFTVKSLQMLDKDVLKLYHGGGTAGTGTFDVPDTPAIQYRSVVLVMVDGTVPLALWASNCSIARDSNLEASPTDLMKIPLKFTPVKNSTNPVFRWISASLA